jgi:hypothetical protein
VAAVLRRRRFRRLVLLAAGLGGLAAWRDRHLAKNQQRFNLP